MHGAEAGASRLPRERHLPDGLVVPVRSHGQVARDLQRRQQRATHPLPLLRQPEDDMKTVRGLLRKMFCASCGAKPTEDEVEEMFKNFGAKVKPGYHLIRLCRP